VSATKLEAAASRRGVPATLAAAASGRRVPATTLIGVLALGVLSGVASCSQVLSIEEAHVDPTLSPRSSGGDLDLDGGSSTETGASPGASHPYDDAAAALSDGSSDEADAPSGSAVCRQYCSDLMMYCTGNTKQYVDDAQCMKACALFPEGNVGDPDANTAACRMKYAGKARYGAGSERDAYCQSAGPGSDGSCGSVCDGYCTLMMATCTSQKTAPYFFASSDVCLTTCSGLADSPPYTVSDGTLPDRNDSQCRLFHAASAVMDPEEHCAHAMGVTMCDPKPDGGS
jgi:hypothetical protein